MTPAEALSLLEAQKNERGILAWEKVGTPELTSFGLGLGQIKAVAKKVPKSQALADALWESTVWDAKQLSCLVGEPKKLNEARLDEMAKQTNHWMLGHIFLQQVMAKSPHLQSRSEAWRVSKDDGLRALGWGCLAYLGKSKKVEDTYFLPLIAEIADSLQGEANFVKDGMNNSLFHLGQRSGTLHAACLEAARGIGTVEVDYGANSCQAVDVVKHLAGDRIMAKFT